MRTGLSSTISTSPLALTQSSFSFAVIIISSVSHEVPLLMESLTRLVSDAISNGTSWDTELIIITAKENELWVRAKGEVEIVDNKPVRIYGTFQDIDEKKKTEQNFLKATERLSIATKGANVGIWDMDITNKKLVWDDNMYHLYGIYKKDFESDYQAWQAGLH